MPGKLYLIPNVIAEENFSVVSQYIARTIESIRLFIVEEEKPARVFLKRINPQFSAADCTFLLLNEHTPAAEIQKYIKTIADKNAGIISESGCPCVADPGADLVLLAHKHGMELIPLVGPSSITLALMASGLNGQNFAFNGYLPKEKNLRIKKIKDLERRSAQENQTQIFMEAPYRNDNLLKDVLASCEAATLLCVACDLTAPTQWIKTATVNEWRRIEISLDKRPALFLIQKINSIKHKESRNG
ncbi:MAG TPA: SAM-dependent methyltransferase [Candidatus Omnitrophota bacterium]|nr:SAM-dependent methyltransferase [Candidatus Omnitrophota bacterium]HPD84863.1 SAM-dependent methyltransferase [Candidatus Omnitrophota bacterium]HRZ03721.1 SAM-dependent methyltransferase [Candidatus Omnitrophota bacterium]